MESVVGILRSLSLAPNYAYWTPQCSKMVLQVVTGNPILGVIPLNQRMDLLSKLEPFILRPSFDNKKSSEILRAKVDMLLLWEYLLEFVGVVKASTHRRVGYTFIIAIMQRDEFSLTKLGFNPTSQIPRCPPQHLQLALRYKTLVIKTFVAVMKSMEQEEKYVEIVHFSAQTMAIFFFTLPLVGGKVVDALEKKKSMNNASDSNTNKKGLDRVKSSNSHSNKSGNNMDSRNTLEVVNDDSDRSDELCIQTESKQSFKAEIITDEAESQSHETAADSSIQPRGTITDNASRSAPLEPEISSTEKIGESVEKEETPSVETRSEKEHGKIKHDQSISAAKTQLDTEVATNENSHRMKKLEINGRKSFYASSLPEDETEFDLDNASTRFILSNPDLFQWNYFAAGAEAEVVEKYMSNEVDNICIKWLTEKHTFFLTFLEVFVRHVQRISVTKHSDTAGSNNLTDYPLEEEIVWDVIPAYVLLLDCFWPLLRSAVWWDGICRRQYDTGKGWVTSQHSYTRVNLTAKALLLSNPSLLNAYIKNTYENTNLMSLWSVDSCVEHVSLWFQTVEEAYSKMLPKNSRERSGKRSVSRLPSDFDFELYWYGISKMLSSELFQVLLKVMSLLYNTLDMFRGQNRINLITSLMTTSFFTLFCHWCPEVRTYFQLLVVYKLLRTERENLPCFTDGPVIAKYATNSETKQRGSFGFQRKSSGSKVYVDEDSVERRMAVIDTCSSIRGQDDEKLIDVMLCSKIDSYVRMCLENDPSIPEHNRPYVTRSLSQYANLLEKYYSGINSKSSENLVTLAHRMIESSTNPYLN